MKASLALKSAAAVYTHSSWRRIVAPAPALISAASRGVSAADALARARIGGVERRLDVDGNAYTREEYVAFYGGEAQWEANH